MNIQTKIYSFFVFIVTIAVVSGNAFAQFAAVVASPVDHPVSMRPAELTPHLWKSRSGAWGETLVNQIYKLRGFDEVLEIKRPGGQGIDHLALKYDTTGKLIDVRFGETKTHFGGEAKLSNTKMGTQLSLAWLNDKLQAMRNSGDPRLRGLVVDICRFRRQRSVSIQSLGEFHDLDVQNGRYVRRNPISGVPLSSDSIKRSLARMKRGVLSQNHRRWATRSLSQWNQISRTSMERALTRNGTARIAILRHPFNSGLARMTRTTASQSLRRVARVAGPIGAAVAFAADSHEIYSHVMAYRRGDMNRRDTIVAVSRSGGGIVGAGAGAAVGGGLGAFGGPIAWVTIPAGATIGGIVGYFTASTAADTITHAWYSNVDEKVKREVDDWIVTTNYSQLIDAK